MVLKYGCPSNPSRVKGGRRAADRAGTRGRALTDAGPTIGDHGAFCGQATCGYASVSLQGRVAARLRPVTCEL